MNNKKFYVLYRKEVINAPEMYYGEFKGILREIYKSGKSEDEMIKELEEYIPDFLSYKKGKDLYVKYSILTEAASFAFDNNPLPLNKVGLWLMGRAENYLRETTESYEKLINIINLGRDSEFRIKLK